MNLFQTITLPAIAVMIGWDLVRLFVPGSGRGAWRMARIVVWAIAATAILSPDMTSAVAVRVGIGRGADLILYGLCLMFLVSSSYWYSRTSQLERQITELTRHLALQEAQHGSMATSKEVLS